MLFEALFWTNKEHWEQTILWLKESVTEYYGEKCDDYMRGCPCCDAWKELESIKNEAYIDFPESEHNETRN